MNNLVSVVAEIIQNKKHSSEVLEEYIAKNDPKFKDLELAFDYIIRSKKMTSDKEKAYCFVIIYNAIRAKSQVPTYPDPKTGCTPKKINDIDEFVEYNKDSIFTFICELDKLIHSK